MTSNARNNERAVRAQRLAHAYLNETGQARDDAGTILRDLIADCCHLADRMGLAPRYVLEQAMRSYRGDVAEDGGKADWTLDDRQPLPPAPAGRRADAAPTSIPALAHLALETARKALAADPALWVRDAEALDAQGQHVPPDAPEASRFSLTGLVRSYAVRIAGGIDADPVTEVAFGALADALRWVDDGALGALLPAEATAADIREALAQINDHHLDDAGEVTALLGMAARRVASPDQEEPAQ